MLQIDCELLIDGEWIFSDGLGNFPERVVLKFLHGLDSEIPKHQHIVRHFHESVNDLQVRKIMKFFSNFHFAVHDTNFGNEKHYEILLDVFLGDSHKNVKKKMFFGIEKDEFFNDYKITGVRILKGNKLKIERTIYCLDRFIFSKLNPYI
jgi:hypothetical protein